MDTIQKAMAIQSFEMQIQNRQQTLSTYRIDTLKELRTIVEVFSTLWCKVTPDVGDRLNKLVEQNNVQYSQLKNDDYSFDELIFKIGEYLPIFSEAGEFITDYEIVRDDSDISVSNYSDSYEISVAYEGQDGFQISLPKNIWSLFENQKDQNFDKNIKQYVESQIQKALEQIETEIIPEMTSLPKKNMKMNKTQLEKQAAALGFKLVPQ